MSTSSRFSHWVGRVAVLVALCMSLTLAGTASAVTTHTIALCATDSTGANITLGADQAWVQIGSSHYAGPVGDTGCRQEAVNDGTTVTVWVARLGTYSQQQTATVTADTTFNFYTTKVTVQYSGNLAYGGANGDSAWFAKPSMELFSNGVTPVRFRLDGTGGASGRIGLLWPVATGPGATYTRSLIALRLRDSTGAPLNGGTARYQNGTWQYAPGSTGNEAGAPGILAYSLPGLVGNVTNEMRFNGTTQTVTQNAATNSIYQFQTRKLTLALKTAGGDPLAGGTASWGFGSNSTTTWFPGGSTAVDGTTSAQFFPGTYGFLMYYKGTAEAKPNVVMPNADTTITWNTATVTLIYSGQLSYGGGAGDSAWFTKPTMNLLAGTYKFHFRDPAGPGVTIPLTWGAGDIYTKSMVIVHLNGTGGGLPGGEVKAYWPGPQFQAIGTTDSAGVAYRLFDGTIPSMFVRVIYHNGFADTPYFPQSTHSIFTLATVDATIKLIDHNGAGLPGGIVKIGPSWMDAGTTDVDGKVIFPVFPGSYPFRVYYNGASQTLPAQDVSSDVIFQTGSIDSISNSVVKYFAGGWISISDGAEILPGTYWFRFSDGFADTQYTINSGLVTTIH